MNLFQDLARVLGGILKYPPGTKSEKGGQKEKRDAVSISSPQGNSILFPGQFFLLSLKVPIIHFPPPFFHASLALSSNYEESSLLTSPLLRNPIEFLSPQNPGSPVLHIHFLND